MGSAVLRSTSRAEMGAGVATEEFATLAAGRMGARPRPRSANAPMSKSSGVKRGRAERGSMDREARVTLDTG